MSRNDSGLEENLEKSIRSRGNLLVYVGAGVGLFLSGLALGSALTERPFDYYEYVPSLILGAFGFSCLRAAYKLTKNS